MEADVPRIRKIGQNLAAVGPTVGDACANRAEDLAPGGGSGTPSLWPSTGVASGAVAKWQAFAGTLKADITGHGDGVVSSANALEGTDADAAAGISAAGGGQ